MFTFSDVKGIDVGVDKEKNDVYAFYYTVKFNDGNFVDFFDGSMMSNNDKDFELLITDFDEKLKAQNVVKTVSKVYFEAYSIGLEKGYVSRIEQLFLTD